jgi:caffeoyl-CoA O-methyltransferase
MMRLALSLIVLMACACAQRRGPVDRPPLAKDDAEKKVLGVLDRMRGAGEVYLEVPVVDGRMLRLLVEAIDAKNVVEIGSSTGHSGLWLLLGLQKTGGRLTTFEYDAGRAAQARAHFKEAGVEGLVTLIEGDAHDNVKRLKGPVDLVFIDADKEGYPDYLNKMLPLVRPGGLILAHNIDSNRDYVTAITSNPNLETTFYMQGGGLGITLKKR